MKNIENPEVLNQLTELNIDPEYIKSLHQKILSGEISPTSFVIEESRLRPPQSSDYDPYDTAINTDENHQAGLESIKKGELVCFWLNGGAATRYFNESKITDEEREKYSEEIQKIPNIKDLPKGITETIQGMSFLELKIRNLLKIQRETGATIPVIIMNSFITDAETDKHMETLFEKYPELKKEQFHKVIQPRTIPRFNRPEDLSEIDLYLDSKNKLSFAPSGHGGFIPLIQDFFKNNPIPAAKHLFFANIDNFGASLDPAILGYHINKGKGRTVELATKLPGDQGGAPCFVDDKLVVVEQMKFPENFDQDQITAFNTNTFWFTLKDLLEYKEELPLIMANKTINSTDDVIQLEQIACDANLDSNYIEAHRFVRFWPTKRFVDIAIYQDPEVDTETAETFSRLMKDRYDVTI